MDTVEDYQRAVTDMLEELETAGASWPVIAQYWIALQQKFPMAAEAMYESVETDLVREGVETEIMAILGLTRPDEHLSPLEQLLQ